MITESTYHPERLKETSGKLGRRVDPKMLEKVVYAFTLLEQLRANDISLIFKGGTCLLLMTDPPRRFSIDIDIITETSQEEIETTLDKIVKETSFTKWSADNERKHVIGAPMSHYKIYYTSQLDQHYGDEPILLDILCTANPYSRIQTLEVTHEWLEIEGKPVTVEVPVPEAILGDKLTAFAPKTTGILYTKGRHTEIIKQLFDISHLFDVSEDIGTVRASYDKVVKEEIKFRKLDLDKNQVLEDTFQACWALALRDEKKPDFQHLKTGIQNITNFIIGRFKIEEAIVAGAKTAYLCQILMNGTTSSPKKYSSPEEIKDWLIENATYNKLNKLKKSNPEAFYYWYQAINEIKVDVEEPAKK